MTRNYAWVRELKRSLQEEQCTGLELILNKTGNQKDEMLTILRLGYPTN